MNTTPPLRILIVDDHPVIRESMSALLNCQENMQVCAEAANGEEALLLFRQHQPDVTLMDLHMPKMNGLQATRYLCAQYPAAYILAFTAETEATEVSAVLQAGAKDCLNKGEALSVLVQAIRRCGEQPCAPTL